MNLRPKKNRSRGYALLLVFFLLGISVFLLSGALQWISTQSRIIDRNNQYQNCAAVAEAAVEKIVAAMSQDYFTNDENYVYTNLAAYRTMVPTTNESSLWAGFQFNDAQANLNRTYASRLSNWVYGAVQTKYSGLQGYSATYRIISNARPLTGATGLVNAVRRDVQLASIPLFSFGAFFAVDMEICPTTAFSLGGRVHCNGSIYVKPSSTLTFSSHVTAMQQIVHDRSPLDPVQRTMGTITYNAEHDGGVRSFLLPIGTNNNSAALHSIIEIPPAGESTNSLMGRQRYFNNADLIILVSNNTVVAKSGSYNNFSVSVPWSQVSVFINTNASFYNMREGKTVRATEYDVTQFNSQYAYLISVLGRSPKIVYLADLRTQISTTQPGIRLINGQTLNTNGLTVATVNPLYVVGHFNVPDPARGTTNTSATAPASLAADAITLLSDAWKDNQAGSGLSARNANNMTCNAAMIAGIVASDGTYYSGGVDNLIRLLEEWTGKTLTINGSLVCLFTSQTATAPWGASATVYNPPTRNWNFDQNFLNAAKLPPGSPQLRCVLRGEWASIQPNTIQ